MGRGWIISTAIKSSQIIGHVHGWIMGSPARAKESQKAQESVASAMEGIYDDTVGTLTRGTKILISRPVPRNTLDDRDVS
jgi:hypothetical protein